MSTSQQPDRQLLPFAGRPEPVERAIGPPALLMRLIEREAKAEHARALPPVLDDILTIWALQVEMPQDAKLIRVPAHRLDRQHVDFLAERAGGMDHRGVDARLCHLLQR